MRARWWWVIAFAGAGLSAPVLSQEAVDKVASAVADSWIGHDASELLVQWPVDRGFTTFEVPNTGETAYSYNFGTDAYSYNSSYDTPIGMDGNGTIMMESHTEHHDVAAQHHCTVVFYANAKGIISRYSYDGVKCRPYVRGWGRPKG
jgi:hypothetical protein